MKLRECNLIKIPKLAGVYLLFNSDRELIYIGMSINIRHRIGQHCSVNSTRENEQNNGVGVVTCIPCGEISYYDYIEESSEFSRKFIEANLIYFLRPKYNSIVKYEARGAIKDI